MKSKIFIGSQALDQGLVDLIGNFETALSLAREKGNIMSDELKTKLQAEYDRGHADGISLMAANIKTDVEAAVIKAKGETLSVERARVNSIMAIDTAPVEARIQAVNDGLSLDASYKLFYEAEQARKRTDLQAIAASVPDPVNAAGQDTKNRRGNDDGNDFMALVEAYALQHKCLKSAAMLAVAKAHPDKHKAFIENSQKARG